MTDYQTTQIIELDGMEPEIKLSCEIDFEEGNWPETPDSLTVVIHSATIEDMATYDRAGLVALIGLNAVDALEQAVGLEWYEAHLSGDFEPDHVWEGGK